VFASYVTARGREHKKSTFSLIETISSGVEIAVKSNESLSSKTITSTLSSSADTELQNAALDISNTLEINRYFFMVSKIENKSNKKRADAGQLS